MTTFYLDHVSGDDTKDGLSFANRWKTFSNGATAARTAPGDVIRIMKSPDPVDTGMAATFAMGATITLPNTVASVIDQCETAWTPSANVTSVVNASSKIEGTNASNISITANFTTGVAAYLNTSSDPAGYSRISFMINQSAGTKITAGQYSLNLYDAVGATGNLIASVPLPPVSLLNQWTPVVADLGTTLTAGQLKSIALNVITDTGAVTFIIDNVMAVLPAADVTAITHESLVAANINGPYYIVQSIAASSIKVGVCPASAYTNLMPGTFETGTYNLYTRIPIFLPIEVAPTSTTDSTFSTIKESGTAGNPITYSGGWNRTDMSTQDGDTYINLKVGAGYVAVLPYGINYVNFERLNGYGGWGAFYLNGGNNIGISAKDIAGNISAGILINTGGNVLNDVRINVTNIHSNTHGIWLSNTPLTNNLDLAVTNLTSNKGNGLNLQNNINKSKITIQNASNNYSNNLSTSSFKDTSIVVVNAQYPGRANSATNIHSITIGGLLNGILDVGSAGNVGSAASCLTLNGVIDSDVYLGNLTGAAGAYSHQWSGCNNVVVHIEGSLLPASTVGGFYLSGNCGDIVVLGSTLANISNGSHGYTTSGSSVGRVIYHNYGGTYGDSRINDIGSGSIVTDTSVRNTASGCSWKFNISSAFATSQLTMPLARIAVEANVTTNVSVYMRRNNLLAVQGLLVKGKQLAGIATDVSVEASNAINTWTQYTLSITPTETGVVDVIGYAYGTGACWFDDLSVA